MNTLNRFLQEGLFDTTKENMNLVSFVVDSLNSGASRGKKRAGVHIFDSYLQKHKTTSSSNTKLAQQISKSTMSMTSLINMLGWTTSEHAVSGVHDKSYQFPYLDGH